ncbi:acetyl-CoA acetyltransferases [Thermosinus carboxydivorans Nor1]|uniref:acetyl-CoA C-acetyltransferase n=1 Tax=Thermosinus carboxydivorans Nor1 TaxID=401526 RepID=A1HSH0_9FIRM|nr:acetyl-CoA C-acetyltransferase [Thermosinus carboxydivorans]EAX47033.1 acetyl-CoA acetyltransferases [Thermosinus carboxydivorans Nor1]
MREVVIVGAKRTPIGDFLGSLKDVSAVDLGVTAVNAALAQARVSPDMVTEVACGMIYKAGAKGNPGRQIQIKCNMPAGGYAYTVDQQCGSGMKALELASQSILLGKTDIAVAVGIESMSQAPYLLKGAREGYRMGHGDIYDSMLYDGLICAMMGYHMGVTAENLAERYNVTRQEQDELALMSHQRAVRAIQNGIFNEEIVPVTVQTRKGPVVVDRDEHPRVDVTLERLAAMKPVFKKDGTVTAGNASSINDGAAALVLMAADKARELGIKPLAKILATANAGVAPEIMGIGPVYAVPKAIKYAGLKAEDIGYYEINEAFAAQFLAVNRELKIPFDKINANGSGIGLGHPVGCTGARIIVSLIYEMNRRGVRYGVASLCVGGGPAIATVIEKL